MINLAVVIGAYCFYVSQRLTPLHNFTEKVSFLNNTGRKLRSLVEKANRLIIFFR